MYWIKLAHKVCLCWLATLVVAFCLVTSNAVAQSTSTYPSAVLTMQNAIAVLSAQALSGSIILDPNNIPSEKVNQFVYACIQVVKLIEQQEGRLQAAETETESLRIEQEIEAEALAIIEKMGLTRQEYLQLLALANTDPEFGERVAVQLQEAAG